SGAAQWLGSWRDGNTGEERRRDLDTGGLELRLRAAPLCARAVAVGFNMIDGMITATAVVATMALIHNNAGDFESFRSCYLDAHPNGSQCGAAGVDPVCIAGMKLANRELVSHARRMRKTCKTKAARSLP